MYLSLTSLHVINDLCCLCLQLFFEHYDSDKSGHITFTEFVTYMLEHEKQLKLSFQQLDHNNDGMSSFLSSWSVLLVIAVCITLSYVRKQFVNSSSAPSSSFCRTKNYDVYAFSIRYRVK